MMRKEDAINWAKELDMLLDTAKTSNDKLAIQAFQKAIGPYLESPELLRTLLGKIQRDIESVAVLVSEKDFDSQEALQKALPEGVKVVSSL